LTEIPTLTNLSETYDDRGRVTRSVPALVIVWSAAHPDREGEALLIRGGPGEPAVFGRSNPGPSPEGPVIAPVRQRPARNDRCTPFVDPRLSRHQLRFTLDADLRRVHVENLGRCPMEVGGRRATEGTLEPGDTLLLKSTLLLLYVVRPETLPEAHSFPMGQAPDFGTVDAFGLVGESPAAWDLRDQAAFVGRRTAHALVHGDSGSGKELLARSIHGLSDRRRHPLVARNAATIPEGLVDAELFGNIRHYPNPGMPERVGLIGEADGSTLFLDEIGEIPEAMQAHLLRVLDQGGEYHRLGESKTRTSDLRLVAATNRDPRTLKHDLLARLKLRLHVPGLNKRREDVPLLVRHLLRRTAAEDPEIAGRFFEGGPRGTPRLHGRLLDALVRHVYTHHVRELETLVWTALASSREDRIELTDAVRDALAKRGPAPLPSPEEFGWPEPGSVRPRDLTPEAIVAALERHDHVQEKAWRALGLKNRFQLMRLLKKHGIS
jgi:DNA-binding NtrC family response regulator